MDDYLRSVETKCLELEAEVSHWREANRASLAAGDILLEENRALRAEAVVLISARDEMQKMAEQAIDELSALRVQLAAAKTDAERYHWLKESQTLFYKPTKYDGRSFGRWTCMWPTDNDDLDAAIDEAKK